jgi:hypothetical protein
MILKNKSVIKPTVFQIIWRWQTCSHTHAYLGTVSLNLQIMMALTHFYITHAMSLSLNLHFLFPFCCIEKYVTKQLVEISYIRISYFTCIMWVSMMNLATLQLTAYSWIILKNLIFS